MYQGADRGLRYLRPSTGEGVEEEIAMATPIQVVFDCADPARLAQFWATALGYKLQNPPEGYTS
jgi:hypothetical protein